MWVLERPHQEDATRSEEDGLGKIPSFNPKLNINEKKSHKNYPYATSSKGQLLALIKSAIAGMGKDSSRGLRSQPQSVPFCSADTITETITIETTSL